jgi:hypothetical protein
MVFPGYTFIFLSRKGGGDEAIGRVLQFTVALSSRSRLREIPRVDWQHPVSVFRLCPGNLEHRQ